MTQVTIIDVAPRDGLQNEPEVLPVAVKVELIERLARCGVPRVEIGSFVNPKQVPQMAGTGEVVTALQGLESSDWSLREGTASLQSPISSLTALVPNLRGYELAREVGLRHVRLVLAASESLNQANFKRSVADSLADFSSIAARARADGVGFGVAIGASFGCPFEGHVPAERVLALAHQLIALGADELVLADTTGMAVPRQVRGLCEGLTASLKNQEPRTKNRSSEQEAAPRFSVLGSPALTVHFHNTRNTGYANAYAALEAGITSFDAALGGIGGCPFAPKAVGNIATEDLVHMLNGMGVETGIDLGRLIEASHWLSEQMGKPLPALVGKSGPVFEECRW
ncbi:MAG: hydroxymethylglutaryl-CoA lyase [Chloroflexaceae bacterium]|jgi:(R)-citramalyl-CoA lyase|nr:hydroxymethylglutaryl-CoA lyase [Chloroflexaceae bacterium]